MEHKVAVGPLTDEERETQTFALDMGILERGKKVVNTYKSDAEYIAEKIISGGSLFEKK